jgi:predicted DNA-binding transcriptional regulator YafY
MARNQVTTGSLLYTDCTMNSISSHIPSGKSDADRRLRQADRLARIMRVLQLLQSRGRWNVTSIAQEMECSERTIHRDLTVLELAGVPWSYDKDLQCYRLRPDYTFPTLGLSDDEVLGLATATVTSAAAGLDINTGVSPASEKFLAARPDATELFEEATHLTQVLDLKLVDHSQHREALRTIQWALVERKQLTGKYLSPYESGESGPKTLTLHPYRLCLVKSAWYLIARPIDSDAPITLRPTRFQSLRMVDQPAMLPEDFDLRAYFGNAWAVYRGDTTSDIELTFSSRVADIVVETRWHHTQSVKRNADDSLTMTFQIDGLNEISRWLLGWAGDVHIVRPDALRQLVLDHHQQAIEKNEI